MSIRNYAFIPFIGFVCFFPGGVLAGQDATPDQKPACASFDARTIADGKLTDLHLERLSCESLAKLTAILNSGATPSRSDKPKTRPALSRAQETLLNPAVASANAKGPVQTPAPTAARHGTAEYAQENAQRFFVRQNALDSFYYLYPSVPSSTDASSASKALGASVSLTGDDIAKTKVLAVQAYSAYVIARQLDIRVPENFTGPYVSKWAIAPFLSANGNYNEPQTPKEKSALQVGVDGQFEVSRLGVFPIQDFRIAPYYQTDFRGLGNIVGVDALWEPYNIAAFLGGSDHAILNDLMFFYWRLIGEADVRHVAAAGLTNLVSNRNYEWLGGTVQAKISLFPNSPDENLANRIYLSESFQYFADAGSSQTIQQFISEIGYNLNKDGTSSRQDHARQRASVQGAV
jgi:hypothetical protein